MSEATRYVLDWGRGYRLWVMDVGLACCAMECVAATLTRLPADLTGSVPSGTGVEQADVLVVSGTVTARMAPAVRALYEQMPSPRRVIAFGACATSGGPYWDSYAVVNGVDSLVPVDVYVPGCPPRPAALLDALALLERRQPVRQQAGCATSLRGRTGGVGRTP